MTNINETVPPNVPRLSQRRSNAESCKQAEALHDKPQHNDLVEWVKQDFEKSGITLDEFHAYGGQVLESDSRLIAALGFVPDCGLLPAAGWLLPYRDPATGNPILGADGTPYVRVRMMNPVVKPEGGKYLSRGKAGVSVFIPLNVHERLQDSRQPLYICEGEKKAIVMAKQGLCAVGIPGVTSWNIPETTTLQPLISRYIPNGRAVVFVMDSDMADNKVRKSNSRKLSTAVAKLGGKLSEVIIPSILTDGKTGCDDFITAKGFAAFQGVLATAAVVAPDRRSIGKQSLSSPNLSVEKVNISEITEVVSEVFIENLLPRIAFYKGAWYMARGGHYALVEETDIDAKITKGLIKNFPDKATGKTSSDVRKQLASEAYFFVDSAKTPPCYFEDDRPVCKYPIALANGYINAEAPEKGIIAEPHEVFGIRSLPYKFIPDAKCPKFDKYLSEVMPDDEAREHLIMLLGLVLIPDTSFNAAFFLYDPVGGSGRSVYLHILGKLVGDDMAGSLRLNQLGKDFVGNELSRNLVNIIGDLPKHSSLQGQPTVDIEALKKICSGDIIRCEQKHVQETKSVLPTARIVCATNHLPMLDDNSSAVWDRLRIIPFSVHIRNTAIDNKDLKYEIAAEELPGILNLALGGLKRLRRLKHFPSLPAGTAIIEELRQRSDSARRMALELLVEDPAGFISMQDLKYKYGLYCNQNDLVPTGRDGMVDSIKRTYKSAYECRKTVGGLKPRGLSGIRAKTEQELKQDN